MFEFLWGALNFVARVISFVLGAAVSFSYADRFVRLMRTGRTDEPYAGVTVPPEPKLLSAAAQRAIAEAEKRNGDASPISDK